MDPMGLIQRADRVAGSAGAILLPDSASEATNVPPSRPGSEPLFASRPSSSSIARIACRVAVQSVLVQRGAVAACARSTPRRPGAVATRPSVPAKATWVCSTSKRPLARRCSVSLRSASSSTSFHGNNCCSSTPYAAGLGLRRGPAASSAPGSEQRTVRGGAKTYPVAASRVGSNGLGLAQRGRRRTRRTSLASTCAMLQTGRMAANPLRPAGRCGRCADQRPLDPSRSPSSPPTAAAASGDASRRARRQRRPTPATGGDSP